MYFHLRQSLRSLAFILPLCCCVANLPTSEYHQNNVRTFVRFLPNWLGDHLPLSEINDFKLQLQVSKNLGKPVGFGVRDCLFCLSVRALIRLSIDRVQNVLECFLGHLEKQNGNKTRGIEKASNYLDLYFW